MDTYYAVKLLHILSAAILFGTGIGIAFFMFRSAHTHDVREKFFAAHNTVTADYLFTLPSVIIQPASGAWLAWKAGYDWTATWLLATSALYVVAGVCWLPVVWIQIQLKKLLQESINNKTPLPERYSQLFRLWFWLGWPAFLSLLVIFYLMITKPV